MTATIEAPTADGPEPPPLVDEARPADDAERPEAPPQAPAVLPTGIAAFLATAAAAWLCAGIFQGALARGVAVFGAALGVGITVASYRTRRPALVQLLVIPAAVAAGAVLVLPFAKGGSANLPTLVIEAVRGGGLAQPPIPFDPGWRFVLVVFIAVVGAAGSSVALGLERPKIGILAPTPLLFLAALVQPPSATIVSSVVALALFVASLGVSYGADLTKDQATSGRFELRRLARGGGLLAALLVVVGFMSQAGFLFPPPPDDRVIPPRRPDPSPPQADRVLFTVHMDRPTPLRLGVLDVYRDPAWMTPPFDPSRQLKLGPSGVVPGGEEPGEAPALKAPPPPAEPVKATFNVRDISGHALPVIANPLRVEHRGFSIDFDPRTQALRVPGRRVERGMEYVVESVPPPTAAQLKAAPPPAPALKEYLAAPEPPTTVQQLLDEAPETNLFDRLQFVRNAYYQKVVAAGAGDPVDVGPARVAQMLAGKEATPYEITAGEVLLARWAGVPARLGYGYFGGEKTGEGTFAIRPKHGANWLEAYFEGSGWVPVVGTPPRAKSSLNSAKKNQDPTVRPTEELAMLVYVPIRLQSIQLLYEVARYWAVHVLPFGLALGLAVAFYPGVLKALRRQRRRRWAQRAALRDRVIVAYAEFRDAANDLNIGRPTATPMKFLESFAADDEHLELAWLVTRAVWGDLRRDLREEDAEAAEDMAASTLRRMRRASSAISRVVEFGARASLRNPYTDEIPNLWRRGRRAAGEVVEPKRGRRRVLVRVAAVAAVAVVLGIVLPTLGGEPSRSAAAAALPVRVAPDAIERFALRREAKAEHAYAKVGRAALVGDGRVFSIHDGATIQGSFQVAGFRPGVGGDRNEVRRGVLRGIGGSQFERVRIAGERVYVVRLPEQRIFAWFSPDGRYVDVMVARQGFNDADALFAALVGFQRNGQAQLAHVETSPSIDPRRGSTD